MFQLRPLCIGRMHAPRSIVVVLFAALSLVSIPLNLSVASQDPIASFIVSADSIAANGTKDEFAAFVEKKSILVGAAIGQLLDAAFQLEQSGDSKSAGENIQFAHLVAQTYADRSGSSVPLEIVNTQSSWNKGQRDSRARAMALEAEAQSARDAGEFDRSVALYEEALAVYEKLDDRRSIAVNYGSLGVVHWRREDWEAVRQNYERALAARRAVEDRILEGKTLNGMGSLNYQTGNFAEAVEWYLQAIELRTLTGDISGAGTSHIYLGNTYFQMARLTDARDQYELAVDIVERLGNAEQSFDLLNGIASIYSEMGRLAGAAESFERAVEIARDAGMSGREVMARCNLASVYREQARFQSAISELSAAEAVLAAHPDPEGNAILYRERGLTRMDMGETGDARDDMLAFLESAKELANPTYQMDALLNVGMLYRELGAYDRGLQMALQVKEAALEAGHSRNYRAAMSLAGDCQMRLGHFDDALASWKEAHDQDEYDKAEAMLLEDKVGIANVLAQMGSVESARAQYYEALPAVISSGESSLESAIHLGIGHTFENENPDSTAAHYEIALRLIEEQGAGIRGEEIRTGFLSGTRRYYYEEVTRFYANQEMGNPGAGWSEMSFHTMERAKARGLANLMAAALTSESSPEEEAVLDSLYRLDPAQADYAKEREILENRFVGLRERRLKRQMAGLDETRSAVDMATLQKTLAKKTVLLEYALGDTASILWVVDRKGHELHYLPPRAEIAEKVQRLRDAITRPGDGDESLQRTAFSLYNDLVAPAADRMRGADVVVIVPDGVLFELPFDALLTEEYAGGWKNAPYMALRYQTVYTPSATVFTNLENADRRKKYELDLVAFGNPDYSTLRGGGNLESLPQAEVEVNMIAEAVSENRRDIRTGAAATETALKIICADSPPRVLHLATHGLLNPVEPTMSCIALGADSDSGDDGYLYTLEILAMPGGISLVVMSACESARGKISRGEGVVGLSRAFIAAGAGGVVASLWAVSDESTAELMGEFYRQMMDKKKPAGRALHEARLSLIGNDRFSHPFYWSPFVVIGSERAPW